MAKFVVALCALVGFFGPFVLHIVWCIDKAAETGSAIALLVVGLIIPPVGWVHGVCALFGWGWI